MIFGRSCVHKFKLVEKARKKMRALCAMGGREGISAKAMVRGWAVLVRPLMEMGGDLGGEKVEGGGRYTDGNG